MLVVQICVGSSCHLKGSQQIVELMQKAVEEYNLDGDVILVGSFCYGTPPQYRYPPKLEYFLTYPYGQNKKNIIPNII